MMTTLSVVPEYVQGAPSYMYTDTTVGSKMTHAKPIQTLCYSYGQSD